MDLWKVRRLGHLSAFRNLAYAIYRWWFPDGTVATIRRGPLRGCKWRVHHGHQFWMPLGMYEAETAAWVQASVHAGDTFLDVGANAGYFTLIGALKASPVGRVVAFEPLPVNVQVLEDQVRLNNLQNVTVVGMAVSDVIGDAVFTQEATNANSHLSAVPMGHAAAKPLHAITVQTTTLDAFVESRGLKPAAIKIDVEGAEMLVLRGAARTLERLRPLCLVSTHSVPLKQACGAYLEGLGYRVSEMPRFEHELVCQPL